MYTFEDGPPAKPRPKAAGAGDDMDVVEFVRTRPEPDEQQVAVSRSQAKRGILNCSRQSGKATILAAKAVHRAYTQAGKWCWWLRLSLRGWLRYLPDCR